MADLRKMTVEGLRELARKVLGPRHSRLKTRDDLLTALEAAEAEKARPSAPPSTSTKAARPSAGAAGRATKAGKGAKAGATVGEETPGAGRKPSKAKAAAASVATKAVQAAGKAARAGARAASRAGKAAVEVAEGVREAVKPSGKAESRKRTGKVASAAAAVAGAAAGLASAVGGGGRARKGAKEQGSGPADPAGFFVARVRGEDAVREAPHPMTETADAGPERTEQEPSPLVNGGFDEKLGELPWGYGDDAFVALPRDPRTLFLYWDLSAETTRAGFDGLDHPRAQLRIYARAGEGWEPVRTLEFAIESRGYYVHELEPGRIYRAEIHAVDRRGADRVIGRGSNEMMLPPLGPSPIIDDRFIRIPWDMPLGRLLGRGHAGGPFSEEARALLARLSDWSRFAVRGGGAGSAGGMGGRPGASWPTSPAPTSPGAGFGGGREGG